MAEISSEGTDENFATGKIMSVRKPNSRVAFSVEHPEERKRRKRDWSEFGTYLAQQKELLQGWGRWGHLKDREERG